MKSLTFVLLMLSLQAVMSFSLRDLKDPIKKCSPPTKIEGKGKISLKVPQGKASGTGTIHVDYANGKALLAAKLILKGTTYEHSIYISNNTSYSVDPSSKQCHKLDSAILPFTVPAGVPLKIKRGEVKGVPVQIWEFSDTQGEDQTCYLTEDKCMFVKAITKGHGIITTIDFYDTKEGIKDTHVFDLPKYCIKWRYHDFLSKFLV